MKYRKLSGALKSGIAITAIALLSPPVIADKHLKITSTIPDQKTINVILKAMNQERDNAEELVLKQAGIKVDIKPLSWSSSLANTAKDRIEKTLEKFNGATQHLKGNVAENLIPYGYRQSTKGSSYPASDLVKGWTGTADSCTDAQWKSSPQFTCGEKAANAFVAVDVAKGTYKRTCDKSRKGIATCGHYGNIIEKGYKSVGCARGEVPHKTDPDITNGGWSCVFK